MVALPGGPLSELGHRRLRAQLLAGPPAVSPQAVTEHLLAVQAQDPRGARLAIRARTSGLTARDVDTGLADRSLVISWLCRGTLHLVCAADYFWLHDLTVPPLAAGNRRRLAQEGVSVSQAARAAGLIVRWLAEEGPLIRRELASRLEACRIPVAGQGLVHILFHATLEGLIVRGPMKGRQHAFVLTHDWLGARPRPVDRREALGELVRRYLTGHSPAAEADIARWAGLPLRDIRSGLDRISRHLLRRPGGLLELAPPTGAAGAADSAPPAPPRLLGSFDPLLCGWKDRSFVTGEHDARVVSGGMFRAFILVDGLARGLWRLDGPEVVLEPFQGLADSDRRAVKADAEDVRRYLLLGGSERA